MEVDIWHEVVKQVPALIVLVAVMVKFLTFISSAEERRIKYDLEREARTSAEYARMGESCHEVQRAAIKIMDELHQEMGAGRELHRELLKALEART